MAIPPKVTNPAIILTLQMCVILCLQSPSSCELVFFALDAVKVLRYSFAAGYDGCLNGAKKQRVLISQGSQTLMLACQLCITKCHNGQCLCPLRM